MTAVAQRSLAGGELAPSLWARADTVKYQTGLRTVRNFIIKKEGGADNRPGFKYIASTKDSTKRAVLIPFVFNSDQTYALEFGDRYIRFIRNGAQIAVSGVTAWSNATAYVIGSLASRLGVNYYCILAHTNQQPPNATYWYPLTGSIYEIPTPYLEADLETLKYNQSLDVVTLTHKGYAVRELRRSGHTSWTLSLVVFAPSQVAPTSPTNSDSGSGGDSWVITGVNAETFEESLQSTATVSNTAATSGSPKTISWTAAAGAGEYNVYKLTNGVYGFIGVAIGTSFVDNGIEADATDTPPTTRDPFSGSDNYPAISTYVQQRLTFGNTTNYPEKIWMGKSANFKNFTYSTPLQDDDAVTFSVPGRQYNEVRHIIDLERMIVFTSGSIWDAEGDSAGIIRPGQINPKTRAYRGASIVTPVIIGTSIVYVQARGSVIRDLLSDSIEGYKDSDLTIFSSHLFNGFTIIDMVYQENPNSVIWVILEDNVTDERSLVAMTYVKEHQVWAWHRHDTDGEPERLCVVPESDEDVLYAIIKRPINGTDLRYIERQYTRRISDIVDSVFLDSALTYDGRNTGVTTMTLSGGTTWAYDEELTLTASASQFVVGDVGNQIFLYDSDGVLIRFTIGAYTSATVVTGTAHKTVPASLQGVATAVWSDAVDTLSGLSHLEGKDVAVFADGFVVASPNNSAYTTVTVTGGAITLEKPYGVIHVGLPYISDLQTLDLESVNGETMIDKRKLIGKVVCMVEKTRGLFVGQQPPTDDDTDPLQNLYEAKLRDAEGYDSAVDLMTGPVDVLIDASWNLGGRVFIRQVDPIPASILSITPVGFIPAR